MDSKIVSPFRRRSSESRQTSPAGSRSRQDPPELFFENRPFMVFSGLHRAVTRISGRSMLMPVTCCKESRYPSQIRCPVANASRSVGVIERSPII